MKKLIIMSAIAMSSIIYNTADAQIGLRVGFNFGPVRIRAAAPVIVEQAPVYDNEEYYYLPDVDAYYNVDEECYYYYNGDNWVSSAYLPGAYRDYDWRNARRFAVKANRPYLHDDFYRSRYDGHPVNGWAHVNYDRHFEGGYANREYVNHNRHFDGGGYRGNDHRFDNHSQNGFREQAPEQRFDNRQSRTFAEPVAPRNQGYNQPMENHSQGGYNQPSNQNQGGGMNNSRGQSQNAQPSNQNPGGGMNNSRGQGQSSQPANQNQGGGQRGNGDHFAQNSPQGGFSNNNHMTRF